MSPRDRRQWLLWRYEERDGKNTKVPYSPVTGRRASVEDPATWGAYEEAVQAAKERGMSGVGFVFTAEDELCGVDLDRCRDPRTGEIEPWAQEIIEELDSYTEISPSGTGVHVLVRARLPEGSRRRKGRFEVYDRGRFFTVTGRRLPGTPKTIESRQGALYSVVERVFGAESMNGHRERAEASRGDSGGLSDAEIVERAGRAKTGERFRRLWAGDTRDYRSASEADLALCGMLAFWTGGDAERMDALFRQSGLYRKKWEREDYRRRTISEALAGKTEFYAPPEKNYDRETSGEHERQEQEPPPAGKTACVTPLDAVEPEEVSWLWPRRIPLGKITLIDGDPGTGKSAMTMDLAARVTRGRPWPDGAQCPTGGVVILSAEDGLADTIRPRLDAAGADTSKILALTAVRDEKGGERQPTIPEDLDLIEDAIHRADALLVVVDPLMAYLAGDVNSHRDQDVRRALAPLARLAERTGAAIVVVRHLNKAQGGNPIYRGGGSIGIVGAARAGMLVAKDPEDERRRVLAPVKSNLAPPAPSLLFSLTQTASGTVRVEWHGESNHDAASLLSAPQDPEERSALDEAKELVSELLADGEVEASAVMAEARRAGISERTLKRAKRELGILSERRGDCNKRGGGTWFWMLPTIKSAKPEPWHSKSETDRTDAENSAYLSPKPAPGLRVPTIKGAKPPGTLNQAVANRCETAGEDQDLPCRKHGERQCEDCWRRVWHLVHEGMDESWAIAEVMKTGDGLF